MPSRTPVRRSPSKRSPVRSPPRRRRSPVRRSPVRLPPTNFPIRANQQLSAPFEIYVDSPFRTPKASLGGPRLFRTLKSRDPRVRKRDYFQSGKWDVDGLVDDLRLL
jgi:hypothetical protein